MISTKDFRRGLRIKLEEVPFQIVDVHHIKMGRGGATVKAKLRNLLTGAIADRTWPSGQTFDIPDFQDRKMQYLYQAGSDYTFMDNENFEQYAMSAVTLGEARSYLKENEEYHVMLFEGQPLSIELPPAVILKITDCEPAVKGDSVSNLTKMATLETGVSIKVPLFVKEGDSVKVDTTTGAYLERANA